MDLDVVQEHVFKKVHAFVGTKFEYREPGRLVPEISLDQREAYIVLKLLEKKKKRSVFSKYRRKGFWWFRIFGYGLHGKDITKNDLTFSERNGFSRHLKIGRWSFKWLS